VGLVVAGRLVHAAAAGDAVARDGERPRDRQLRVERPDRPVLEDHRALTLTLTGR
jgi:hypothetical protein